MADRPPDWPKDVEPMVLEDLERLGTDKHRQLYWDGKQLRTQLSLTVPQTALAVLAALASLATIFTGLNNGSIFLCARGISWLGCPSIAAPAPPPVTRP